MASKKISQMDPKLSMADSDEFTILDNSGVPEADKNKRVTKTVALSEYAKTADLGTAAAEDVGAFDAAGTGASEAASAVGDHETTYDHTNLPTAAQKAALANPVYTPSGAEYYVTVSQLPSDDETIDWTEYYEPQRIEARNVGISQATDIGAALVDSDEVLVYDGSASTNRKSDLSRFWTYIQAKIAALTDISSWGSVVDEDDMASNDATKVPTQQSVKAYVDANAGGASDFTDLGDTPADYSGQAGKLVKVNPTADGLIFGDPSGSSVSWGDITGTIGDQTDLTPANIGAAPAAQGVTNGDSHDHSGGDGAQIAYSSLSGLPTLGTAAAEDVDAFATGSEGDLAASALQPADVDDTPVNGATEAPVSSNWAFDHVAAADPHPGYRLESADISLTADVTGTLPAANGGTGQTSLASVDAAGFGSGSATDGHVLTADGAGGAAWEAVPGGATEPEVIQIACSDETTALTAGTAKATFRMPFAMTLSAVRASVTTAPTGSVLTVDINEGGTSILSTKITIDVSEKTSTTAATAQVISDSSLADDAEITIDLDTVGSTVAGTGLKVSLIGTRT